MSWIADKFNGLMFNINIKLNKTGYENKEKKDRPDAPKHPKDENFQANREHIKGYWSGE